MKRACLNFIRICLQHSRNSRLVAEPEAMEEV